MVGVKFTALTYIWWSIYFLFLFFYFFEYISMAIFDRW